MKTMIKLIAITYYVLSVICLSAFAQGTAFTYQGRLNDGANPATGLYDVRFSICDALANGNVVAGPLTNSATGISNGLFTVTLDFGGGVFRAASFAGDRIETCLFVGPARDAGDWDVVKTLFAADSLSDDQRRMLLSGKSADGLASAGPVVCACFGVGSGTILAAIASGAATAAEIGVKLKAGTNCGSCIPEMKRLIAQAGKPAETPHQQAATAN